VNQTKARNENNYFLAYAASIGARDPAGCGE
jgi:hypothetical protein